MNQGYRNIYYDNFKKEISLWKWDSNGNRILEKYDFKPFLFIESQNIVNATSIYNTKLKKIEFINDIERRHYVKSCGIKRIFYNLQAEQQALIDYFGSNNENPNFSKHPLKIFYLDIETFSPNEFPIPEIAKDPINAITIYDTLNNQYLTWGLQNDYTPKCNNHRYYKCFSEEDLLKSFLKYWTRDYPDLITSWNLFGFDLPYIINRITKILGEDEAKTLSPVNRIYKQENIQKNIGGMGTKWHIKGLTCIDYMDLYKTFSRDKQEKYSLDYISNVELGDSKLAFNATSLSQLSTNDWATFIDYNKKDVELITKLEDKLQFLKLARSLAYLGLAPIEAAMGTISIVTGAMALKALKRNKIISTFISDAQQDYPGGFVKEPEPSLCESVVTFDVNSLYPNTIITLNLSPETKIGKILSETDEGKIKFKLNSGKEYIITKEKFNEFIKMEKISISSSNVMFSQKEKGICAELIEDIYRNRVKNKQKIKDLKHKRTNIIKRINAINSMINNQELIEKKKELEKQLKDIDIDVLQTDIQQHAAGKIFLNRIYGSYANKYSPFYDIDCASSITLTGQRVIKETEDIIRKYVKEKYDVDENCVKYQDTDSCGGTSQIITNNGIFEIKDLFEANENINDNISISQHGHEIIDLSKNKIECLTFDSKNKQIKFGKIKKLIRHKVNKKMYKIKVNGKEIITTEDHGLMVYRNGQLIRVSPKEIQKDDKMVNIYEDTEK